MRAVYFDKVGEPLKVITVDDPEPGPGEVVIEVARCGICGSDAHLTQVHGYYPEQSILGHEFSGEVVAVGKDVEGYAIGDRITAMPAAGCGKCRACVHGVPLFCENGTASYTGGFADYMRIGVNTATHLPQTLSLADGALTEPLAVSLHGVAMAQIKPGQPVLVLGAGAISLGAIFWARRLGAGKIVALSRSRRREEMALKMGADVFVQGGENEVAEVQQALGGAPEIVFEGIGVEGALQKCVNHVAVDGKIVSLGFCTNADPVIPAVSTFKQVNLLFSMAYTMREFEYCAHAMDKGLVDPGTMVTRTISLEEVPAMIEQMQRGGVSDIKIQAAPSL
ncbi:alcohol dehydrogenase catalytic domain-containing protein [Novosphingobium malaysiense]|uniref:Alcohol dehydrogenase n=1 Tax=Novosphingobium malaysiense TaxID=1348853 RepID=A0A0B1ZIL8_9SPHN|nr:alcohol dehydrogenase catalytic domain-containing protein [Novosphingobium malaysiense]KHK89093.1 alcohol dehydrogenase [Novosphingobium malaysiense]